MTITTPFALRLSLAQGRFDRGEFSEAATALAELVDELETGSGSLAEHVTHGTSDLRMLLARAYFHSAQLGRAESTLTRIVADEPTDGYAHLLLGRTLQRAGRHEEAARPLALAEVLGGYERPAVYGSPDPTDPTDPTD
ncbi:MAG: hypothetical protein JWP82_2796 [Humibacillus sp.]|nr:hypothetical protein [Humibacillus sp.]